LYLIELALRVSLTHSHRKSQSVVTIITIKDIAMISMLGRSEEPATLATVREIHTPALLCRAAPPPAGDSIVARDGGSCEGQDVRSPELWQVLQAPEIYF